MVITIHDFIKEEQQKTVNNAYSIMLNGFYNMINDEIVKLIKKGEVNPYDMINPYTNTRYYFTYQRDSVSFHDGGICLFTFDFKAN